MALYIMAMTINPSAKKLHHDLSNQVSESLEAFAQNHVKMQELYATLGRYDYLAVFETNDQTLAFKVATQINSLGILETETWPVIPYDEYSKIIG